MIDWTNAAAGVQNPNAIKAPVISIAISSPDAEWGSIQTTIAGPMTSGAANSSLSNKRPTPGHDAGKVENNLRKFAS